MKPVAILGGGRIEAARKAVASRTGSLAGSREVFSAGCTQTLEHIHDAAKSPGILAPPHGPRAGEPFR